MDNFGSFRIVSTLVCNIMTITRASFISTLLEIKTLGTDVEMKNFLWVEYQFRIFFNYL